MVPVHFVDTILRSDKGLTYMLQNEYIVCLSLEFNETFVRWSRGKFKNANVISVKPRYSQYSIQYSKYSLHYGELDHYKVNNVTSINKW